MDMKTVSLHSSLKKEMYVCQPEGFINADYPSHVYKLKKALYGLKQAPMAWYDELSKFLLHNHFFKGIFDPMLFIRRFNDDILMSNYALQILKKYGMESCDPVGTPMEIKDKLDLDQNRLSLLRSTSRRLKGYFVIFGAPFIRVSGIQRILELTGFLDANYARCKDTFKSTFHGAQLLGEKLVSWSSKKQDCTTLFTMEAEYVSLSACCA
uniref:Reverse transcriptase Ty1/copia-type domain-containing protein n=1 Tax=Tanacetum cinerariifolium TaxID=118510 RepID=A0A6L2KIT7_TANCI|nr:hypothetical protein [Tanacetum cinerariifolium]